MKNLYFIILFLLLNSIAYSQELREINCLSEYIYDSKEYTKDGNKKVKKYNQDTGTSFTIDEKNSKIKVIKVTRFDGNYIDEYIIVDSIESPYAKIYTCYNPKEGKQNKYFISIQDSSVTFIIDSKNIVIETPIISNRFISNDENQDNEDDYIEEDDWKQLNIPHVLKRTKKDSQITGTYKINSDNVLKVIELTNDQLLIDLSLYNGVNLGHLMDLINFENNKGVYENLNFGVCKFELIYKNDRIQISTIENGYECGYGNGVRHDGEFIKADSKTPTIEYDE